MKDNYSLVPKKHIAPYDGMSITAEVWSESHNYHHEMLNAHQYFLHGAGIVTGLEVMASDPADTVLFILPGVAIDSAGRMIVLSEPVAYDLGHNIAGKLRLLLMHRDVKAQAAEAEETNAPAYLQDEFVIVARADELNVPFVELARIDRKDPQSAVSDAQDRQSPQVNEIDLRFREPVCPAPVEQVLAGVVYLGEVPARTYDKAFVYLAPTLSRSTRLHIIPENNVPLNKAIFAYRLLYIVAAKGASFAPPEVELLQSFVQNGGKLLVEFGELAGQNDLEELLATLNVNLEKVTPEHPAFQAPYLFQAPPAGGFAGDSIDLWFAAPGILATTQGYGAVWSNQPAEPPLSRGAIRDALEWGANLLQFLLEP